MKIKIEYNGHIDGYYLEVYENENDRLYFVNEEIDELLPITYEELVYKFGGFKDESEEFYGFYFETKEDASMARRTILNTI